MIKQIKLESGDVIVTHKDVVGHLTGWIESLYKASKGLDKFGILSALILDTNKNSFCRWVFHAQDVRANVLWHG